MQFISAQTWDGPLPKGYTCPESQADIANGGFGTTHYLDDFGEELIRDKAGFERVNSYGEKPSALGKYRVLTRTLLPCRQVTGGKHFTYFRHIN